MTTATITIKNIETTTGKGRPVSAKTKKIRTSIINFLRRTEEVVTTNDVAKATKQAKQKVIAQLRWLESRGVIAKAGTVKVKAEVAGRPSAMWKIVEEGAPEDMTARVYKQKQKEFMGIMVELTPVERAAFVHASLKELLALQMEDEVEELESIYRNKKGFTAYDAKQGTIDAMKEQLDQADVAYWLANRRLFKYNKQLGL